MTLNSCNTMLRKLWGSLGITRYSDRVLRKHHTNVFCYIKDLEFRGEINELQFDACRLFTQVFYDGKTILH